MKLVIADDESLVRYTLRSMISEMEAPWQIVGESANGAELMELLAEHQPNVAIVDIRMPKMNGLEAIRLGRMKSPLTKWILLSGYSDFHHAQEALKLGVSQYLLKPISPADLENALFDTYKDNKELMMLHNQQFCNNLSAISNGLISIEQEESEGIHEEGYFVGAIFHLDVSFRREPDSAVLNELYKQLHHCIHEHLIYGIHMALFTLPTGELTAIGAWEPEKNGEGRQQIRRYFDCAAEITRQFAKDNLLITIFETREAQGFVEMNKQLQQLQSWIGLRTVCGIGRRMNYELLEREAEVPGQLAVGRLLSEAQQHIQDRMYLNYQNVINELELVMKQSEVLAVRASNCSVQRFIEHAFQIKLTEETACEEVISELRRCGECYLRELKSKENPTVDLAQQVIHYIDKHYRNDISIGQIASHLNVSSNYLSTLFHKKTGVTFLKYVTRIRMMKASEMLLHTNLQIKQIAEEVGYFSTRHFTKLFTETFNRYPSDYRKIINS